MPTISEPHARANAVGDPITAKATRRPRRHVWLWRIVVLLTLLVVLGGIGRALLPGFLRDYVNRTLDRNPMFEGKIGDIEVFLWRGAYVIDDVRLMKRTGNVPVPLFAAKRVDLAIQWSALQHGKIVGRIKFENPELNFVDGGKGGDSQGQTGAGGPWLQVIRDLFPFKINSAEIDQGMVHFRSYNKKPPFDVYLSQLDATVENLSNVRDETTPNIATIKATALAQDQGHFEMQMKLNPFSYRPSFQLATRLVGVDVTKLNELTRGYGAFDFKKGFFDLVIELRSHNGELQGYVKPLFRDITVFSLIPDIKQDNAVEFFWEALVGAGVGVLKNPPRDQFGTVIPVSGDIGAPNFDVLATIGNVLRNAFVRAYLPQFQPSSGTGAPEIDVLQFGRGSVVDPPVVGKD